MKRCPTCNRVETDESLSFCRADGTTLVSDSLSLNGETATAQLGSGSPSSETATNILPHLTNAGMSRSTGPTTVLPSQVPVTTGALGKPKRRRTALIVVVLVVAIAAIVSAFLVGSRLSRNAERSIESIAVLPFVNKSGDANSEYLSDGLAESLIYRLSQLPNLKVSPTSSVIRYKNQQTDVAKIAGELGVDAVMTGRLAQIGDSLTISVELVDVRKNKLLWGEQYERKMSDLLATQREIAAAIAEKLQLKLGGDQSKGITKKYTDNNEAYQLYLKGRFHFAKRSREDVLKAVDYFGQAIQLDPNFALAYARVAEAYNQMPIYPYLSAKEAGPKALAAAKRALEIDPSLPEAHAALGNTLVHYERNWPEAERAFKRAIELDPNNASAHYRYGTEYLVVLGRTEEAVAEVRRAIEIEPLDLNMLANLARVYLYGKQPARALEEVKKSSELDPNFVVGRFILGMAYNANGLYADTIALTENALKTDPNSQFMLLVRGYAYARAGRRAEAEATINRFTELSTTGPVNWSFVAAIYAGLGEKDKAFAELQKAYDAGEYWLTWFKIDPMMNPLHDDPRFAELVKRLKLPG